MPAILLASLEAATGLPAVVVYGIIFVLGACIGSFLNVVIYRVPERKSLLPGSRCPNCDKPIPFFYNVPILGWFMTRGKCSNCGEKVSVRYPAIELLTALIFVVTAWQFEWGAMLPVALAFVAAMIALIFIDADHMILPNAITYPLFVLALAVSILYPALLGVTFTDTGYWPISLMAGQPAWLVSLAGALLGALIGGGSLWLVGFIWEKVRGVEAMGLGDVKMMFGVGALLGWRLSLLTIFAGAFSGAIIGIVLISRQKDKNMQAQIPFGIFLGTGAIIALLFGERIMTWYLAKFM